MTPHPQSFSFVSEPANVQQINPVGIVTSAPFQRGSDTSKEAAVKALAFVAEQGWKVLAWIEAQGEHGATQKEAEAALDIGRPSLCARFRALEQTSMILKTGKRRQGCRVYRVMRREAR